MKTGVFFCTCGDTSSIDYRSLAKTIKKTAKPEIVEVLGDLCQDNGLSYLIDDIRRKDLEKVLIGCTFKNRIFEETAGDSVDMMFVNLREHCGWVHGKKDATVKAGRLVNLALNSKKPVPERFSIPVGEDILITGQDYVWSIVSRLADTSGLSLLLNEPDRRMQQYDIPVHIGTVQNVSGKIGDFSVDISIDHPVDFNKCTYCGSCIPACPKSAIDSSLRFDTSCDQCGKCVDACPVDAIDLHRELSSTINCGQVVVTDPEWAHLNKIGIHLNTSRDQSGALMAAMDALACTGTVRKDRLLRVHNEGCAAGKSAIIGCTLCESACPHDAIKRVQDKIIFDDAACMGCGACTSVCPVSVPQLQAYPDDLIYSQTDILLQGKDKLSPVVIMFTCDLEGLQALDRAGEEHLTYPPVLPVFVPCINAVHEAHILRAFDSGADGVILLGCEDCTHKTVMDPTTNPTMNTINAALAAVNLGERFAVINVDSQHPETLVHKLTDFTSTLIPRRSDIRTPDVVKGDNKRSVLVNLIAGMSADICKSSMKGDFPFADITIDSKCTFCSACMNMCPSGALNNRDGRILFNYSLCIACGLCEKACPEQAITLEKLFDAARLLDPEITLYEPEMVDCMGCGKPFITSATIARLTDKLGKENATLELLQYCPDCRPVKAIEKGLLE